MIILSQDKTKIISIPGWSVEAYPYNGYRIIARLPNKNEFHTLGYYDTPKRMLEVIQEIFDSYDSLIKFIMPEK